MGDAFDTITEGVHSYILLSGPCLARACGDVYTWVYIDGMKGNDAKRVKVAVYLEARQKAALGHLTQATRVPWAEYVREGVDLVLAKHTRRRKAHRR